jgi:hypothetical protein
VCCIAGIDKTATLRARTTILKACGAIVKKLLNTIESARKSSEIILRKDACNEAFPGGIAD